MDYNEIAIKHKELVKELAKLSDELSSLPSGKLAADEASGKHYLMQFKNGKMESTCVEDSELTAIKEALEKRPVLESRVFELRKEIGNLEKTASSLTTIYSEV